MSKDAMNWKVWERSGYLRDLDVATANEEPQRGGRFEAGLVIGFWAGLLICLAVVWASTLT